MKLELTRLGVPPMPRKDVLDADGWRQWAYDAASEAATGRLVAPVTVLVVPQAADRRGVKPPDAAFDVVRLVLAGLVSAGVLGDPADVVELTVRRPTVGNQSGFTIRLSDALEPF